MDPRDFAGLTGAAVVAGGTGGIGSAVVRTLAARGAKVVATYRSNADGARALVGDITAAGGEAEAVRLDLADADACRQVVDGAADRFGGLHTLVYAAGPHVPMRHLSGVGPTELRAQLEADAVAFYNLVHPALPLLRRAGGAVVAVTTAATRRFPARDGLSAVPKGAVEAIVRAVAVEEGRFGIRANSVGPGMLSDGMAARLMASGDIGDDMQQAAVRNTPLRRFGTTQDVAEAVCFLASPASAFVSGQYLAVDGGYSA